jgi:hypothetical protein
MLLEQTSDPVIDPAFPEDGARQLLDAIANTDDLVDQLNPMRVAVRSVKGMLGDYTRVDTALAVWNEHAVGRIVDSRGHIERAAADLAGAWGGSAYESYTVYSGQVLSRMKDVEGKMEDVSRALAGLLSTIRDQYQTAVEQLFIVVDTILSMVEDGSVKFGFTRRALEAIEGFISVVETHIAQALDSFHENTVFVNDMKHAVATLSVPAPQPVTIDRPGNWEPR